MYYLLYRIVLLLNIQIAWVPLSELLLQSSFAKIIFFCSAPHFPIQTVIFMPFPSLSLQHYPPIEMPFPWPALISATHQLSDVTFHAMSHSHWIVTFCVTSHSASHDIQISFPGSDSSLLLAAGGQEGRKRRGWRVCYTGTCLGVTG